MLFLAHVRSSFWTVKSRQDYYSSKSKQHNAVVKSFIFAIVTAPSLVALRNRHAIILLISQWSTAIWMEDTGNGKVPVDPYNTLSSCASFEGFTARTGLFVLGQRTSKQHHGGLAATGAYVMTFCTNALLQPASDDQQLSQGTVSP